MMVVMVVSRRVGQVTFAVSLRTSCRNLNGLKAIVCPRRSFQSSCEESEQPSCAQPSFEGEPQRGLDCPGMKSRAGDPKNGPAAGSAMYCGRSVRSRSVACGKIKMFGAD